MHKIQFAYNDELCSINLVVGYYTEDVVGEKVIEISIETHKEKQHLSVNTTNMLTYNVDSIVEAECLFTGDIESLKLEIDSRKYIYVRPFRFNNLRLLWNMHSSIMYVLTIDLAGNFKKIA